MDLKERLLRLRRAVQSATVAATDRATVLVPDPGAPARGGFDEEHGDRLRDVGVLVDEVHAILRQHGEALDELFRRGEEAATALYHEVLASRMRPFSEVTGGFPRMIMVNLLRNR